MCWLYVAGNGLIGESADRLLEKAPWLQKAGRLIWLNKCGGDKTGPPRHHSVSTFLGTLMTIILLLVCGPCTLNCIVSLSLKVRHMVAQGYRKLRAETC